MPILTEFPFPVPLHHCCQTWWIVYKTNGFPSYNIGIFLKTQHLQGFLTVKIHEMTSSDFVASSARRKVLFAGVSSACYEAGFASAERSALETLSEMLQSFICELGRSSRAYCELAGRTEVIASDVIVALAEMGFDAESVISFAKRPNRISLPTPSTMVRVPLSKTLTTGEKRTLPSYIPEHYPSFPDPHTYIRTPTHRKPITEYDIIREKSASQKRDIERALTRFIAKTGPTNSLYPNDDAGLFPLIACKPCPNPYFSALLFSDQIFDEEPAETSKNPSDTHKSSETPKDSITDIDIMDNPYLRPAKIQRKRRK